MDWSISLLGYIQNQDHEGIGLYRSEIRQLFENDPEVSDDAKEESWVVADYHLHLLETAGFVVQTPSQEQGDRDHDNFELTWEGHNFLDEHGPTEYFDFTDIN
ncbi:DUF2513 domain-containing protein [Pseudomonas kielensis]|uniref:DUF2513 domain-containing protein n=1 Tax=Pseudomonas kielensis TaxID=2762577 RepID=UPI00265FB910|nr:DUF2513 domain-containing protein [Pseudomonas kielensis]WKL53342.1 DUF2513 domain-containing protein [Pseudomonas kielensis]